MSELSKYIEEQQLEINELKEEVDRLHSLNPYADLELSPTAAKIVLGFYLVMGVAVIVGVLNS